jgi:integrase
VAGPQQRRRLQCEPNPRFRANRELSNPWAALLTAYVECLDGRLAAGLLTSGSAARYQQVFDLFCRFAVANGSCSLSSVSSSLCARFVEAPLRGGRVPCTSTSRLRLSVLRSALNVPADAGVVERNPTGWRSVSHVHRLYVPCPLTPLEAARLLLAGALHPVDTLRPAMSALAICGATHGEIAAAVVADLDVERSLVRLVAGRRERWVSMPPTVVAALTRRVAAQRRIWRRMCLPWDPARVPLALGRPVASYPVNSVAPTVSAALTSALRTAGVTRPGVRPKSIREYAANAVYARSQRVESVAEQLGLNSLDTAARLLDPVWLQRWGAAVREGAADAG